MVWRGAALAQDGTVSLGALVTVYSAVTLLHLPLRHIEEMAMAYVFSRPSAVRVARVLALERGAGPSGGRPSARPGPGGAGKTTEAEAGRTGAASLVPGPRDGLDGLDGLERGDLFDPVTGLLARSGRLTAVVCGDPDTAGELAERLGGHASSDGPSGTSVLLGGTALDALPLDTARTSVLVQDKDPVLLSGTLRELLDVPASGAVSAARALEAARCGDVLDALARDAVDTADPFDAWITERGRSLSGGQRQRLALARSLLTDPEVLVLDEPTSAVDTHTEARIAVELRVLREGRTTVVFTSSPLLLDQADQVALLDGRKVVATGTHRELTATEPRYRSVVARGTGEHRGGRDRRNTGDPGASRTSGENGNGGADVENGEGT